MKLYLNEVPRTFIISGDSTHALIVRHPFPQYKQQQNHNHLHHHHHIHHGASNFGELGGSGSGSRLSNKVLVEFVRKDLLNLGRYKDITPNKSRLLGFLGLLNVNNNIYLGFITKEEKVATPIIGEDIHKVTGVNFYCLNSNEFDYLLNKTILEEEQFYAQSSASSGSLPNDRERITSEYPAASVRKFLGLGSFYYSKDFDITSNLHERGFHHGEKSSFKLTSDSAYFARYHWNAYMISDFIEFRNRLSRSDRHIFDQSGFLTPITRGYAQTVNTVLQGKDECLLTLISKQACNKHGPLFGDWGCDDNGSVSNFVETEVVVYTKEICFSYVLIRGNVPIFWELERTAKRSLLSTKKNRKLVFPRSFEASQSAFSKHFDRILNQYGDVHIVNSLSNDPKTYKGELDQELKKHIECFNSTTKNDTSKELTIGSNYKLTYTDIPLSTSTIRKIGYSTANPREIVNALVDSMIDFGALFYEISKNDYTGKQLGVFRVNSFDSLAKANFISKVISQEVIELAFRDVGILVSTDLYTKHAKLWSENDEALKKITLNYAAISTKLQASSGSSTKSTVKSHLSKKYLSGVVDPKASETSMLKLLGRLQDQVGITIFNPLHDYVSKELKKRSKEFSSFKDISLFASTFNVNGNCYKDDIKHWLFPNGKLSQYDVVLVGIQEIVELTAGQMVNTDSSNRVFWENKIKNSLRETLGIPYASLWSGHMGGIALLLIIKEIGLTHVSNIEGAFKKTGFGGISANKGAVAVSFRYSNTDFCFVASHLAAGLNNIDERHANYKAIANGVKFSKNKKIRDHDAVIWLGDFNFRIDLANEQVRSLVEQGEFAKLFEYDQLNRQMASGETFPFYDEMEIRFPPTYKFDNGTSNYDTSEKLRIPAWTDRILYLSKNKIIKQLSYTSIQDLVFSDHRPVCADFTIHVNVIDETTKKHLANEMYESYRKDVGDINESIIMSNNLSFLFQDELNDKILPAPSSEVYKWWLEGGKSAKINIPKLNKSALSSDDSIVINPKLPPNPFTDTEEPEFITKKELLSINKNQ